MVDIDARISHMKRTHEAHACVRRADQENPPRSVQSPMGKVAGCREETVRDRRVRAGPRRAGLCSGGRARVRQEAVCARRVGRAGMREEGLREEGRARGGRA